MGVADPAGTARFFAEKLLAGDVQGATGCFARLVLHESAGHWSISVAAPWGERFGNC